MITIQVTNEGILIQKAYFHAPDNIEIVKSAEYILIQTKKLPARSRPASRDFRRFWASFGAWQDNRLVEIH